MKFRKTEAIEAVQGEYGFWYSNGVFLANDRGDGLAPLGYEPVEPGPTREELIASTVIQRDRTFRMGGARHKACPKCNGGAFESAAPGRWVCAYCGFVLAPLGCEPVGAIDPAADLLAVIHGDGGQYCAQHGREKACKDAEAIVVRLRCELEKAAPPAPRVKRVPDESRKI
jgi:ribosomal protein L37AE/L43A